MEPWTLIESVYLRPRMFFADVRSLRELTVFVLGVCCGCSPPHGSGSAPGFAEFVATRFRCPAGEHWAISLEKEFGHLKLFPACKAIGKVFDDWRQSAG